MSDRSTAIIVEQYLSLCPRLDRLIAHDLRGQVGAASLQLEVMRRFRNRGNSEKVDGALERCTTQMKELASLMEMRDRWLSVNMQPESPVLRAIEERVMLGDLQQLAVLFARKEMVALDHQLGGDAHGAGAGDSSLNSQSAIGGAGSAESRQVSFVTRAAHAVLADLLCVTLAEQAAAREDAGKPELSLTEVGDHSDRTSLRWRWRPSDLLSGSATEHNPWGEVGEALAKILDLEWGPAAVSVVWSLAGEEREQLQ